MPRSMLLAFLVVATPATAQTPPSGSGQGRGPDQPIVKINSYDGGTVNLRNGCVITFNSYGRRMSSTRRCTVPMETYARGVFHDHQLGRVSRPGGGDI